jgi:hypothetical protein
MEPLTSTARARPLAMQVQGRGVHTPSRVDWRDEVSHFFLPYRFSDGGAAGRSLLTRQEIRDLRSRPVRDGWSWRQ